MTTITVSTDHIPGVPDEDYECGSADEAVSVLASLGVRATETAVLRDGEIALQRGGAISWRAEADDDDECEGHESTDGPIGNVVYCDGSCR